jgi:hypothetical protein
MSADLFDSKLSQAIVDLVASDIPLDREARALIADELRRLYLPDEERGQHRN